MQYFLCGHCKHLHCCVLLSSSIFLPPSLSFSLCPYISPYLSACSFGLSQLPTYHTHTLPTSPLTFAEHPVGNKTLFHPINRRQLLHRWWFFFALALGELCSGLPFRSPGVLLTSTHLPPPIATPRPVRLAIERPRR